MPNLQMKEEKNEHAIKCVIQSVDDLCDEYAKMDDDGINTTHLELSTARIVDELQLPTIEHAKHEVLLLTKLFDSLSRLIDRCDQLCESRQLIESLKCFRQDVQRLFSQCPVIPASLVRSRVKSVVTIEELGSPSGTTAERTETPPSEAKREGHEQERSDRVVEMNDVTLNRLEKQLKRVPKKRQTDSSDSTMAVRTPTPLSGMTDPEDKSQHIWLDEAIRATDASYYGKFGSPRVLRMPSGETSDLDATATPTMPTSRGTKNSEERADLLGVDSEATIQMKELQRPSVPSQMKAVRSRAPKLSVASLAVASPRSEQETSEANPSVVSSSKDEGESSGTKIVGYVIISLTILGLVFCVAAVALHWLKHPTCKHSLFVWQVWCSVANTFCENYGRLCSAYCASGLQCDKWHREC